MDVVAADLLAMHLIRWLGVGLLISDAGAGMGILQWQVDTKGESYFGPTLLEALSKAVIGANNE